jgi:undecaprenyl pyrophosphate synthase
MIEQSNAQIERRIKLANTSQRDKLDNIRNQLKRIERKRESLDNWLTSMEEALSDTGTTVQETIVKGSRRRFLNALDSYVHDTTTGKLTIDQIKDEFKHYLTNHEQPKRQTKRETDEDYIRYINSFKTFVRDNPNVCKYCS